LAESRIREDDVQAALRLLDHSNYLIEIRKLRHVPSDGRRIGSECLVCGVEFWLSTTGDEHVRTFCNE